MECTAMPWSTVAAKAAILLRSLDPEAAENVLTRLAEEQAGEVLKRLLPEMRREVSLRLSHGVSGTVLVVQRLARALLQKCRTLEEPPSGPSAEAKFKKMAGMLRSLEEADRM